MYRMMSHNRSVCAGVEEYQQCKAEEYQRDNQTHAIERQSTGQCQHRQRRSSVPAGVLLMPGPDRLTHTVVRAGCPTYRMRVRLSPQDSGRGDPRYSVTTTELDRQQRQP